MNQKFHERFAIRIDREEAERRFVNRLFNRVFNFFVLFHSDTQRMGREIATAVGEKYYLQHPLRSISKRTFTEPY